MYEKEMAEKNKILVVRSGSWLYGLNTPTSDEDYVGIFIPDIEYLLGFKTCKQVDMGYKSKLENGKNSSEAIDCTFYSITKFVNLALNCNPNIIELLFVNEENIVYINDYGRRLLAMRDKFLSEKAEATFFGYAKSQKRKIEVKRDTYLNLVNAMEYLKPFENKYLLEIQLEDSEKFVSHFKDNDKYLFRLGDISINKNITAKKACSVIKDRIGECGNRIDLIKDRGYDTKFTSHVVRLMVELKEIAKRHTLTFPIVDGRNDIMRVKLGQCTQEESMKIIEKVESECREVCENLKGLTCDRKYVEKEVLQIIKDVNGWN